MAYAENLRTITLEASTDLTERQHHLVKKDGARGFVLCEAGDTPFGVLLNKPSNRDSSSTNSGYGDGAGGTIALIDSGGVSPVVAGGEIEAGSPVAVGADGRAVAAGSGEGFGVAQEAASAAGEVISVTLARTPATT